MFDNTFVLAPLAVPSLKLRVNMSRRITYVKQVCSEHYVIEDNGSEYNGMLAITPIRSDAMKRTFEVMWLDIIIIVNVLADLLDQFKDTESNIRFLARRMDVLGQLTPHEEVKAGQAELVRSVWLAEMLRLMETHGKSIDVLMNSQDLLIDNFHITDSSADFITPKLFLAKIQDPYQSSVAVNSDIVICQPYVDPASISVPNADDSVPLLEALSHLSLCHTKGQKLITGFKSTCINSHLVICR